MASDESVHSVKPLAQPRTQQACQRCRALKSRCLPSEQQGICQRCLNSKRDCVWPENQQRTKMPRGPSRISQVEKKIDGLVARIANSPTSRDREAAVRSPSGTKASSSTNFNGQGYASPESTGDQYIEQNNDDVEQHQDSLEALAEIHTFEFQPDDDQVDQDATADCEMSSTDEALRKSLQSNPAAQKLLQRYQIMAKSFPFVPLSKDTTVEEMCRRKPILLLAIMTVSSWDDRKLQKSLEKKYRYELAHRTIIQPQKTVALLQSLLVFIGWYHYVMDPKFMNASILQITVGLAADLKLDPVFIPRMLPGRDRRKRVRGGKDGQRALLGCYYLCSMVCCALRTTNHFKITSHMFECCTTLEEEGILESDRLLVSIVRTQYLDDQVCEFLHPSGIPITHPTPEHVLAKLNIWQAYIKDRKEVMEQQDDSSIFKSLCYGVEMETYHSIFRSLWGSNSDALPASSSVSISSILSACLECGRSFLDGLLAISTDDYHLIPFSIWMRLPHVLIVVAMLTSPSNYRLHEWDYKAAKDRLRLDLFIESLCFRMQTRSVFSHSHPEPDFWMAMKTALQSVGKWYKGSANRETSSVVSQNETTQYSPQVSTWNLDDGSNGIPFSNELYTSTGSISTFVPTPESTSSLIPPEMLPTFQSNFAGATCPMMNTNPSFDLDQFMDMGFWSDITGDSFVNSGFFI